MTKSLEGKVALVTGASHGQGANHAKFLAREGANIVALDICEDIPPIYPLGTEEELHQTVADCEAEGVNAIAIKADVRSESQIKAAVEEALERLGRIDFLLNNAGVCKVDAINEMPSESIDAIIDTNVKGIFYTTKYVVPGMIERGEGRIISTSSAGGVKALPYVSHYAASKGAVVMATKSWAAELAPYGINVNCVCPGTIFSGMITGLAGQMEIDPVSEENVGLGNVDAKKAFAAFNANNLFEGERGHVTVDDISNMMVFLCKPESRMVTGQAIPVDAGWTAS
ncbi:MAG: SDR family NAD(P)-dependent oxidoreductase [Acidimicrobiales bacterium]